MRRDRAEGAQGTPAPLHLWLCLGSGRCCGQDRASAGLRIRPGHRAFRTQAGGLPRSCPEKPPASAGGVVTVSPPAFTAVSWINAIGHRHTASRISRSKPRLWATLRPGSFAGTAAQPGEFRVRSTLTEPPRPKGRGFLRLTPQVPVSSGPHAGPSPARLTSPPQAIAGDRSRP